jgi:peptidoglycan/LPS O-acetylase OafA/YrhL
LRPDLKHYTALDGMRGLAALLVVIFHADPFFGQLVPGGYLAVDMFFVLSGFVIEHAYGQKLRSRLGLWMFTKLRLIRFYPLYLVGLAAGIALELAQIQLGAKNAISYEMLVAQVALALIFVPAFFEIDAFPLNVPAWSLFIELLVNIAYGVTGGRLKDRTLYVIAIVSAFVLGMYLYLNNNEMPGPHVHDLPMAFVRSVFSFTIGVIVYRHRKSFDVSPLWVLLLILVLLLSPVPDAYRFFYDLTCIVFVFPMLVWIASGAEAYFMRQWMVVLGGVSYGIYAVHYPIIWIVRGVADKLNLSMSLAGIVMLLALVLACYLLDKMYDQPLRNWLKNRLLDKRRAGV